VRGAVAHQQVQAEAYRERGEAEEHSAWDARDQQDAC
jgi:hypothetical protein